MNLLCIGHVLLFFLACTTPVEQRQSMDGLDSQETVAWS